MAHRILSLILLALASTPAAAVDVALSGLFPHKALVQIDGGAPQTLSEGQRTKGVVLVSVESDGAIFDIQGERMKIAIGLGRSMPNAPSVALAQLSTDARGLLFSNGQVNGVPIRFLVDTGATLIVLPASEAKRLSLDYRKGVKESMETATGKVFSYRIKLDRVSVGNVTLDGVDAAILEGEGPPFALLGMSFLKRTNFTREGDTMTLTARN